MTRKSLTIGILGCVLFANGIAADTLDLRNFSDKLKEANELEGIAKGSPEASMLESLNEISQSLQDKELSPEDIDAALTLLESTDLIEESFPKEASISFGDNFLAGSDLSVSDLTNSSFFLNSLSAKKLSKIESVEALSDSVGTTFSKVQNKVLKLSNTNVTELISELKATPEIDLVQLTSTVGDLSGEISTSIGDAETMVSQSLADTSDQLASASNQVTTATQSLSFAAGAAMAAAAYSLDQAATAIANTISAGVSVDLESASQGLGFDDFASAVEAYNQQYGTNYTTQSAKEALGQ